MDVVDAPNAPLGAADVTRRYALQFPDGTVRFLGLTRPEGRDAAAVLAGGSPADWSTSLVAVVLPVVLSDGAGPHLLDPAGRLVLAVAPHPGYDGARVAMAAVDPADVGGPTTVGLVRPVDDLVWMWQARATVSPDRRVAALDELDAIQNSVELSSWQSRWE
jgi:hypothetical protein